MKTSRGFTVLELVLALAIFSIAMLIAQSALTQGLQLQSANEQNSNAQNRIRRVSEVITQDIRTSALGMLVNDPYPTTSSSISVAQLAGGAGYSVSAVSGNKLRIVNNGSPAGMVAGNYLVVVDRRQGGVAVVTKIAAGGAPSLVSSATNTYEITTGCSNLVTGGFSLGADSALFTVNLMGYSYDADNRKLIYREQGSQSPSDVTYDISRFRLDYIYTSVSSNGASASDLRNPDGYLSNNKVLVSFSTTSGGFTTVYTLNRVQLSITAQEGSGTRAREYTNSSQVDLINNNYFQPKQVTACGL